MPISKDFLIIRYKANISDYMIASLPCWGNYLVYYIFQLPFVLWVFQSFASRNRICFCDTNIRGEEVALKFLLILLKCSSIDRSFLHFSSKTDIIYIQSFLLPFRLFLNILATSLLRHAYSVFVSHNFFIYGNHV